MDSIKTPPSDEGKNFLLRRWGIFLRFLVRRRGIIWRGLLSWFIGCFVLATDEINSFDTRLQIRGNQAASDKIILITLNTLDFDRQRENTPFRHFEEIGDVTDSYYWKTSVWKNLIQKLLSGQPRSIGVTLFLGDQIDRNSLTRDDFNLFHSSHIYWAGLTPQNERTVYPIFAEGNAKNAGSIDLLRDEDGVIRRFSAQTRELEPLVELLSGKKLDKKKTLFINYRGDNRVFKEYSLSEILNDEIPIQNFKNKIILIGTENSNSVQYQSPFGSSHRHGILAHMTDHLLSQRSILRVSYIWYALGLFILMFFIIFIMTEYPQSVAFAFLLWIATLWVALSVWVFDIFYFWIPLASPVIMIISCYVIFLGYQANKIERKHFQLEQQQKSLQQLEQLKNNFVSLISHDLKTPISKIQAIVDRLILSESSPTLQTDLRTLRESSDELNKYIQSILQMLRVESRDFRLHSEVGDLNEMITDALQQLRPWAREKNVMIQSNLEPLFSSEFDHTLIREVMVNLLENAMKYTPANGCVTVSSKEFTDAQERSWILVEVQDTGEGISSEDLKKIWGKFVRGKDQDMKSKGTGLGLYLVKFFIELHGGQVWIESQLNVGTKVSFTLPVEQNPVLERNSYAEQNPS